MKKTTLYVFAWVVIFIADSRLKAQGTIYLSNLGETGAGYSVGGGWQSFQTGISSNGYNLNSVTLVMGNWLGNASNFLVSIRADDAGQLGTSLATLNGNSDPETAGEYNYTASNLILNPDTVYWILVNCDSFSPNPFFPSGGYAWQGTLSPNYFFAGDWVANRVGNSFGSVSVFQFAVNATAVTEPASLALFVFGFACLARACSIKTKI